MGRGSTQYELSCTHENISAYHAGLRVLKITGVTNNEALPVLEFNHYLDEQSEEEHATNPRDILFFEYIRLPESSAYLLDDRVLVDMNLMGYVERNTRFSLVLMLLMSSTSSADERITHVISMLDRAKFDLVTEDAPNGHPQEP